MKSLQSLQYRDMRVKVCTNVSGILTFTVKQIRTECFLERESYFDQVEESWLKIATMEMFIVDS